MAKVRGVVSGFRGGGLGGIGMMGLLNGWLISFRVRRRGTEGEVWK